MLITTKYNVDDKVYTFNGINTVLVTITSMAITVTSHHTTVEYYDNYRGATYTEANLFDTKEEIAHSILKQIGVSPNSLLNL